MRYRGEPAAGDGIMQAGGSRADAVETDQQLLAKGNGCADAASGLGTGGEGDAGSAASSGSHAADLPDLQDEEAGGAAVLGDNLARPASAASESSALPSKEAAIGGLPFDDSGFRDPHVGSQKGSSRPGTAGSLSEHGGHHQVGIFSADHAGNNVTGSWA